MSGEYKAYREYKDSGVESVGDIPSAWEMVRTKNIFSIKKRIAGKLGYDVLSITQKGVKKKDIESGEGQLSMDYSKYQLVFVGDFAMNHMDLLTGYVDISSFEGVTSPDYRVFSIENTKDYVPKYYLYLLQNGYKQKLFFHLGQGSAHLGRWRLPTEAFNEILYPKPNRFEQESIAAFLDHETAKIDTLIEEQKTLIRLLQEKRQAVISHAVTKGLNPDAPMKDSGVEWLGEVPEHWEVTHLKYLVQDKAGIQMGPFGGMLKDLEYKDTGFKLYGQENTISGDFSKGKRWLTRERYYELSNYNLEDGDIVLTRKGSLGNARLIKNLTTPGVIDSDTIRVRVNPNKLNGVFLSLLTHEAHYIAEQIQRTRRGSVLPGLNSETIANLKFLTPPLEEQGKLVAEIQKITAFYDHSLAECLSKSKLLQERRTALISAAVTGKIDVRDWTPPAPQQEQQQEMALCN